MILARRVPPAVDQVECHPGWQQHRLSEFCQSKGVHLFVSLAIYQRLFHQCIFCLISCFLSLYLVTSNCNWLEHSSVATMDRASMEYTRKVYSAAPIIEKFRTTFEIWSWRIIMLQVHGTREIWYMINKLLYVHNSERVLKPNQIWVATKQVLNHYLCLCVHHGLSNVSGDRPTRSQVLRVHHG